jgi:hypothetical protein
VNLADRKKKLDRAKGFITSGKKKDTRKQETVTAREKNPADKSYATYYLPRDLIRKIRWEAIKETDSGRPSHVVERILEDYFKKLIEKD